MGSRGTDQFYFILTSDGSMDVYPDNKTSSFRISLKDPINVTEDDWEMSLISINYPYTWTNVGNASKVYMKYCTSFEKGTREIAFPDWLCQSVKEVVEFVSKEIQKDLNNDASDWRVWFTLDELGRFKISSNSPEFDVGFSPNMLKLLGLAGHPEAEKLTVAFFEDRQRSREVLRSCWRAGVPINFQDDVLRKAVESSETAEDFFKQTSALFDATKALDVFSRVVSADKELHDAWVEYMTEEEMRVPGALMNRQIKYISTLVMYFTKELFKKLIKVMTLKGVTPGIINPVQRMFVYTNIIQPIDMNEKGVKLLKLVNTRGEPFKTTHEDFLNPTYLPLLRGTHSMISVLITDENGDPVSFQSGTVVLTLHFRRALSR